MFICCLLTVVGFPTISDMHIRLQNLDSPVKELRMMIELDCVYRYPVMCEKRVNEAYFTGGGEEDDGLNIPPDIPLANYPDRR